MRTLACLLLCAALCAAAPFDQIDCWAVRDSIAHAEVGTDTVALGGAVMAWCIRNASADTVVYVAFEAADDATAVSAFFPIAASTTSPMFTCGIEGTYALTNLYVAYADSTGVGDPVYILCWGDKD